MNWGKWLDYLYPPRCPVCDRISAEGICADCRKKLVVITDDFCMKCGKPLEDSQREYCPDCSRKRHVFRQNRALLSYRGPVKLSLYRMKYANRRDYAEVYGREMAVRLGPWIRRCGITRIIPVPLHKKRQRKRGYNQAAKIARALGRELHIPVDEKTLVRVRNTIPQKALNDRERRQNLKSAFQLQKVAHVPVGERVLLIDDIYTTGSTLDAAAFCLVEGCKCTVYAACIAIGG